MKPFFSTGVAPNRVLLLLPTERDCALTTQVLGREGIECHACDTAAALERELGRGAGAVFVCEELLPHGAHGVLARAVANQPRWSDLPVLILSREGVESRMVSDALGALGNVMLLERPLRLAALTSNVRTALRARERQYQIARYLDDIAEARDQLALSARRKDEFLAMLGHELRNPLAPIRNALHLLGSDTRLTQDNRDLGMMMKRQVDHMVRLVDDLIDVSRISRGTITLRRERVDVAQAIASAVELSRPLLEAANHRLELDVPATPLSIDADPVRIAQVFGNLLNNAAKYAEPGGCVSVSARAVEGMVRVSVRDRGIGIEPEMLPHVFELFTQGRRDRHRAQDGLGIGLTLVRNVVELHGGRVGAHSEGRGRGAEFVVELPLALQPAPAVESLAPLRSSAQARRSLRVLVVDDNADSAESMGMVLDMVGMDHRVAYDGPSALDAVQLFRPDVVLLDIGMPGMDGYEVARRIRQSPLSGRTVLIALTGWSQPQDRQRSHEAGFDHHLSKPVDIGALQGYLEALEPDVDDVPANAAGVEVAAQRVASRH